MLFIQHHAGKLINEMFKCFVYVIGVVIVRYVVKLMEILIVVLLLSCGGSGKLQHFIILITITTWLII